jgi:hypothetical protein
MTDNIWDEVNSLMDETMEHNKDELDMEKIEPFSDDCKFGKNGIWLFIGPQGSGKTHKILQTILYTEMMDKEPYFDNIIFSSTSDSLDKTFDSFKSKIKTRIEFVPEKQLMGRLDMHLKRKAKFYSMMKYIKSNGKVVDNVLKKSANKHRLLTPQKTSKYIKMKIEQYGHPKYPSNLLLILDDYLGSDLLESKQSAVVKFLTKCRHYNITCIISQQSTKGIGRTVRRLASDACLWRGFGQNDFDDFTKEFNFSMDRKKLYEIYRDFKDRHDCMIFHSHLDEVDVEIK